MNSPLYDWIVTLSAMTFMSFVITAAFVAAWQDRRGAAHRLPFLALTAVLALSFLVAVASVLWRGNPYPLGDSLLAHIVSASFVFTALAILWHGFGTSLKAFASQWSDPPEELGGSDSSDGSAIPIGPCDPVGVGGSAQAVPRSETDQV